MSYGDKFPTFPNTLPRGGPPFYKSAEFLKVNNKFSRQNSFVDNPNQYANQMYCQQGLQDQRDQQKIPYQGKIDSYSYDFNNVNQHQLKQQDQSMNPERQEYQRPENGYNNLCDMSLPQSQPGFYGGRNVGDHNNNYKLPTHRPLNLEYIIYSDTKQNSQQSPNGASTYNVLYNQWLVQQAATKSNNNSHFNMGNYINPYENQPICHRIAGNEQQNADNDKMLMNANPPKNNQMFMNAYPPKNDNNVHEYVSTKK